MSALLLIPIGLLLAHIGTRLTYWYIIYVLAIFNYNIDDKVLFELSQKDKVWRDVSKIQGKFQYDRK